MAGTVALLNPPLASTTARQRHDPRFVVTLYPSACGSTDVTVVSVLTGAFVALAYAAMKVTTSSMLM